MQAFATDYIAAPCQAGALCRRKALFDLHGIEEEIERALSRRVDSSQALPHHRPDRGADHGGCEHRGFVGGRTSTHHLQDQPEAAQVIARQLRLRNLGGIIICDFIDMDTAEHQNAVLDEFRKMLANDRTASA